MDTKDKTDIVMALREVARGIEHGDADALSLMQALGTELLVLALESGPRAAEISDAAPDVVEGLIRRELAAIIDTIAMLHQHRIKETDILTERLVRMFDPAMAWNEAINRAIEAKKQAKETIDPQLLYMSPQQKFMFETFQIPTTMKALRSA